MLAPIGLALARLGEKRAHSIEVNALPPMKSDLSRSLGCMPAHVIIKKLGIERMLKSLRLAI